MNNLRKYAFFILVILILLPLLGGCRRSRESASGESAAGGRTVVTFRSWSPIIQTTRQMIAATEARYPDIRIEAQVFNRPEYLVDLQTRAASATLPDIVGLEPGAFTQQYRSHLTGLQDLALETWGNQWQENFDPVAVRQMRLGNPKGDENYYGLPILTQTINMWYTIPLMEEIGMEPPVNYEQWLAASAKAKEIGVSACLIGAQEGWINSDMYIMIINDLAPGLIYRAEDGEVPLTDPAFIEAFRWWKRLFDDGIIQPGALGMSHYPIVAQMVEEQKALMFPMGAWWQQQAARENTPDISYGMAGFMPMLMPDLNGDGIQPIVGSIDVMLGMTQNAENTEAAGRVLTDWVSGEGAQKLINTFNDLPAFKGLDPEEFQSDHQKAVWDLFTKDWQPRVQYSRKLKGVLLSQALADALAGVAAGDLSPEEAVLLLQEGYEKESL